MTTEKALTLWQPWASLVAIGAKKIETRSWPTDYRGPLLIHAAKRTPVDLREFIMKNPFFYDALVGAGIRPPWYIPQGVIVARCELVDCRQVLTIEDIPEGPELFFGDYSRGRWMWFIKNPEPITWDWPARGHQRLWNCEVMEPPNAR